MFLVLPLLPYAPREVVKDLGQQEVEQRPELGQVILQRRAREEHAVSGAVNLQLSANTATAWCKHKRTYTYCGGVVTET